MEAVINLETGEITYFQNGVHITEEEAMELLNQYVVSISFNTQSKSYLIFVKPNE